MLLGQLEAATDMLTPELPPPPLPSPSCLPGTPPPARQLLNLPYIEYRASCLLLRQQADWSAVTVMQVLQVPHCAHWGALPDRRTSLASHAVSLLVRCLV